MIYQRPPNELTITVAGGVGSASIGPFYGLITDYSIDAPTDVATYDIDITETTLSGRTFGRGGRSGCIGDTTIRDEFHVWHTLNVNLKNATAGVYYISIWSRR